MAEKLTPPSQFGWISLARAVWFFLGRHRLAYAWRVIVLAILFFYAFVPAYIIGQFVDALITRPSDEALLLAFVYASIISGSWIVVSVLRISMKRQLGDLQNEINYEIKVRGFERLIDFTLAWHQQENAGNKIQRIETGALNMRQLMRKLGDNFLIYMIEAGGSIVLFSLLGWSFVVFMIVFVALFVLNEVFFQSRIRVANDAYNQARERSAGTYYEGASNLLTVKSLGIQHKVTSKVDQAEFTAKEHNKTIRRLGTLKWKIFQGITGLAYFVFLMLIAQQYVAGAVTAGMIFAYYTYFMRLHRSAGDMGELSVELVEHKSGIERMMPIFQDEIMAIHGTGKFPAQWDRIAIQHGAFRYATDTGAFAIKDLDFVITRNEKIGIVGASGSGKSTLAKLFLGLYPLEKGTFLIGDKNYYDISREEVARNISIVLQETELFNLSMLENLTLYKKVSPELLARAVEIAQLGPVLAKLPEGLDTLVGEKGYKLSGGERQRVGIARAICSNASVLVFDEATSALDSKTEAAIQRGLETAFGDKTMIIIAHRLSTLKHVDRIVVFEDGQIVEEGTFESLLKKSRSRFAALYRLQNKQRGSK